MKKPIEPRKPLRDALQEIEGMGVIALESTETGIATFDQRGSCARANRLMEHYTRYLQACLVRHTGVRLTLAEARKVLGFAACPHPAGPVLQRRDALMEALGWPAETLTIEELEERVHAANRNDL